MKAVLVLVVVACVSAQRGQRGFRRFYNSDMNPCGAGVRPWGVTCPNGDTFDRNNRPPRGSRGPCGECTVPAIVTCSDNSRHSVPSWADVRNRVRERTLNSDTNPCGPANNPTCGCPDGASFTAESIIDQLAACGQGPTPPCKVDEVSSCTCPDLEPLDQTELRKFIKEIME